MRPTLFTLGPWGLPELFVVFIVAAGFMFGWQILERRFNGNERLSLVGIIVTLVVAALFSGAFFLLINRYGPVDIKAWGTMLVLAFTLGVLFVVRWGNRKILTPVETVDCALWMLLGSIIGSRIIFVVQHWSDYAASPEALMSVWQGGLSYHGGLLGGAAAAGLFAWRRKKKFAQLADQFAPAIALSYAVARFGCFLNGCCHGHPTTCACAMVFPHGEIIDVPVHPTQLYAIGATLVIFAILLALRGRLPRDGHLFLSYLALYSVARFFLEFTRAGATGQIVAAAFHLTVGQIACIAIFIVAAAWLALTWKTTKNIPQKREKPKKPHD